VNVLFDRPDVVVGDDSDVVLVSLDRLGVVVVVDDDSDVVLVLLDRLGVVVVVVDDDEFDIVLVSLDGLDVVVDSSIIKIDSLAYLLNTVIFLK